MSARWLYAAVLRLIDLLCLVPRPVIRMHAAESFSGVKRCTNATELTLFTSNRSPACTSISKTAGASCWVPVAHGSLLRDWHGQFLSLALHALPKNVWITACEVGQSACSDRRDSAWSSQMWSAAQRIAHPEL